MTHEEQCKELEQLIYDAMDWHAEDRDYAVGDVADAILAAGFRLPEGLTEEERELFVKCERCDGTGIVDNGGLDPDGNVYHEQAQCDECRATGYIPSQTRAARWIPCRERMPPLRTFVLCCLSEDDQCIMAEGMYDYTDECWYGAVRTMAFRNDNAVVTHWMPLPPAPTEVTQ